MYTHGTITELQMVFLHKYMQSGDTLSRRRAVHGEELSRDQNSPWSRAVQGAELSKRRTPGSRAVQGKLPKYKMWQTTTVYTVAYNHFTDVQVRVSVTGQH